MKFRPSISALCALGLLGALAAAPALASTLYDNSTVQSYSVGGDTIDGAYAVTDSFTLTSPATISQVMFGDWLALRNNLSSVQWAITTSAFGGSTLASGDAASFSSKLENHNDSSDMYQNVFSIPNLTLSAGTYFLQLDKATFTGGGADAYWDLSYGPSSAVSAQYGAGPSETFALYGTDASVPPTVPPPAATPEPSSLLLLGSGLAGLAGMIKRRLSVTAC